MKPFNTIVAEIFNISESEVRDEMSSADIEDWDSMNYLLFIAELEKEFDISFSMDQVMNAKTLGDLHSIVIAKK